MKKIDNNKHSNDMGAMKKRLANIKRLTPIAQKQSLYPFCTYDQYKDWIKWIPRDYFFSFLKKSLHNLQISHLTFYPISDDNSINLNYKEGYTTHIQYKSELPLYPDFLTNPLVTFIITIHNTNNNKSIVFTDFIYKWNFKMGELITYRQAPNTQVFTFLYNARRDILMRSDAGYGNPSYWTTIWNSFKLDYFYMGILIPNNGNPLLRLFKKKNFKLKNLPLKSQGIEIDPLIVKPNLSINFIENFFATISHLHITRILIYVSEPFAVITNIFLKYNKMRGYEKIPYYLCKNIRSRNGKIVSFKVVVNLNESIKHIHIISYNELIPKEISSIKRYRNAENEMNERLRELENIVSYMASNLGLEIREFTSFSSILMRLLKHHAYDQYNFPVLLNNVHNYYKQNLVPWKGFSIPKTNIYTYKLNYIDAYISENYPIPLLYTETTPMDWSKLKEWYGFIEQKIGNEIKVWYLPQFDLKDIEKGKWSFHHYTYLNKPFNKMIEFYMEKRINSNKRYYSIIDYILNNFLNGFNEDPTYTFKYISNLELTEFDWVHPIDKNRFLYNIKVPTPSYTNTKINYLIYWTIDYYKKEYIKSKVGDKMLNLSSNILYMSEALEKDSLDEMIKWELLNHEIINK